MSRFVTIFCVIGLAVVLTACPTDDEPVVSPPADPPSPPLENGEDEQVSGTLEGDAQLEGGCAWLLTDDGERVEVFYPPEWSVEFDPLRLIGPDGEVHAEEGDEVTVSGRFDEEEVSVCQVGPIFSAAEVENG